MWGKFWSGGDGTTSANGQREDSDRAKGLSSSERVRLTILRRLVGAGSSSKRLRHARVPVDGELASAEHDGQNDVEARGVVTGFTTLRAGRVGSKRKTSRKEAKSGV